MGMGRKTQKQAAVILSKHLLFLLASTTAIVEVALSYAWSEERESGKFEDHSAMVPITHCMRGIQLLTASIQLVTACEETKWGHSSPQPQPHQDLHRGIVKCV